jgi:hypothetical protein
MYAPGMGSARHGARKQRGEVGVFSQGFIMKQDAWHDDGKGHRLLIRETEDLTCGEGLEAFELQRLAGL